MSRPNQEFRPGDKIRIMDDYVGSNIYQGFARNGNEAYIRGVKSDRWGLPMILIEWDKNHWTYNGAPDGWTFPDHFEKVIEGNVMDANAKPASNDTKQQIHDVIDKFADDLSILVASLAQNKDVTDTSNEAPEKPIAPNLIRPTLQDNIGVAEATEDIINGPQESPRDVQRQEAISTVLEKLEQTEAFILIGVERQDNPKLKYGLLEPYQIRFANSPAAEILTEALLSSVGASAHHELVMRMVMEMYRDYDTSGDQ